jgi:GNAT superfamily N-acetyltransferase
MSVTILEEDPNSPDARMLIAELDALLEPLYPATSRHGYSVDKLLAESVAFFVVRNADVLAGCGGVKIVGKEYAELKRIYIRPPFRGLGLGRRLVAHLELYAAGQGIQVLRLETGIHQHNAIRVYEGMGYRQIQPFGDYLPDPQSRCYEKTLGGKSKKEVFDLP